jgi:hypothetical protein
MHKTAVIVASVLVGGLLSANVSKRPVSVAVGRSFTETYAGVDGETRPIILPADAVGSMAIEKVLLEEPAVQGSGALPRLLRRSERSLPLRELPGEKPRVWVFCRSRIAGPFLLITDLDGAWELRGATHQIIERTLRVAFGSRSVELSSWRTGAMYHRQSPAAAAN